ncbi:MAG: 30S ribosomal protein S8 [Patescibacteria group bacterium]|nr:30S ribosomal protein S8 [Patescibacteria group bacterium]
MHSDPIADMLTRLRNASRAKHDYVDVPYSRINKAISNVLLETKFIREVNIVKNGKFQAIKIGLDPEKIKVSLKRISKPGRRVYISVDEIKAVLDGFGIAILSTSKGVMTGKNARKMRLGGELLCEVW